MLESADVNPPIVSVFVTQNIFSISFSFHKIGTWPEGWSSGGHDVEEFLFVHRLAPDLFQGGGYPQGHQMLTLKHTPHRSPSQHRGPSSPLEATSIKSDRFIMIDKAGQRGRVRLPRLAPSCSFARRGNSGRSSNFCPSTRTRCCDYCGRIDSTESIYSTSQGSQFGPAAADARRQSELLETSMDS